MTDENEQALLARLNALKQSSVSFETTKISDGQAKSPDDLISRFQGLGVSAPPGDLAHTGGPSPSGEDEQALEELLADLGPEDQWEVKADEAKSLRDLLSESEKVVASLKEQKETPSAPNPGNSGDSQHGVVKRTAANRPNAETSSGQEDEAEGKRLLDSIFKEALTEKEEVEAGSSRDGAQAEPPEPPVEDSSDTKSTVQLPDLPAAPDSELPALPQNEEEETTLALPSAPTSSPARKSKAATKSNLPKFTDEEIDTWCVICNDDATVRCLGCDGDLYCAKCWREGHVGPDVGFEERTHRWVKYRRR